MSCSTWSCRKAAGLRLALAGAMLWASALAHSGERRFELAIAAGQLQAAQAVLRVVKGDQVHCLIRSDLPGELHLHAYRLSARVTPDQPAELHFTAHASGRFQLEWHAQGAAGRSVQGHHTKPLTVLEVLPQ